MPEPAPECHDVSLATWDLSSPLIVGRSVAFKVGTKCAANCALSGRLIELRNADGDIAASAELRVEPWPGTAALYWTELSFTAPLIEGSHSWNLILIEDSRNGIPDPHPASFHLNFKTAAPPEHRVFVKVSDDREQPVAGVEVRLGPYRGSTGDTGSVELQAPKGEFELTAWKLGYAASVKVLRVAGDRDVEVVLESAPEPEQEYWMG